MLSRFSIYNRVFAFGCMVVMVMLQGMQGTVKGYPDTPDIPQELNRKRSCPEISPQGVLVSAENSSRSILGALSNGASGEALEVLLKWYERFPALFGKIRWSTPEDQKVEAQATFKYKLTNALHYSILQCLCKSSSVDGTMPEFKEENNCCITSIKVGCFSIGSRVCRGGKQVKHFITSVDESLKPTYNEKNKIKKVFMKYLFSISDAADSDFRDLLQELLVAIPQDMRVDKEQFYHAIVFGMISFMGSSFPIVEAYSGEGRADLILVTDLEKSDGREADGCRNCIIEFKYNKTAKEALDQIEAMNYSRYFGEGSVVAVGINIKGRPFEVTCAKKIIDISAPKIKRNGKTVSGIISWP